MSTLLIRGTAEQLPLADASVDLVMTSPPYADARRKTYGGVHPDRYVEWFRPIGAELFRVLKPHGSFVLNIKEKVVKGERHPYVHDLIAELRRQGWRWVETYVWHKKNCAPGKWPNRFRDAWEHCIHFAKSPRFFMDQDAVRVPAGDWQRARLARESRNDGRRHESRSRSGFGRKVSNWVGRTLAYPSNVLRIAPETRNQKHSAPFPVELPEFFIKLFAPRGGVVLDPFAGSGTVGVACEGLGRHAVLVELLAENVATAAERLATPRAARKPKRTGPPRPDQLRLFNVA